MKDFLMSSHNKPASASQLPAKPTKKIVPMDIEAAARIRRAEVKKTGGQPQKVDFNARADKVAQKRRDAK